MLVYFNRLAGEKDFRMDLKNIDIKAYIERLKQKLQSFGKKKNKDEESEVQEQTDQDSVANMAKGKLMLLKQLPKASQKKLLIYSVTAIIGLFALYFVSQYWSDIKSTDKATQYIMQQVSQKSLITQKLGSSVRSTARGQGNVKMPGLTGTMTIPVKGSMRAGSLEVTLSNGTIEQLWLVESDGTRENIMQMEQQAATLAKQKAAEKAKQDAIVNDFNQSVNAMKSKNYPQAIAGFVNAINGNYRVADAYEYLGIIYSQQGDYNNCIVSFTSYLKLKANDASAHYQLAYCYLQRYDTQNALAELQKACQLGNQDACEAQTQITVHQSPVEQKAAP